jgi:hypothetical protein
VLGTLTVGPQLSVLRAPLPVKETVVQSPTLGGVPIFELENQTRRFVSPGIALGATAAVPLWRALSLEVAATAAMQRVSGDAVRNALEAVPWPFPLGARPLGTGGAQWRPMARLGLGVSYGGRAMR